ncbi:hypothetical protein N9K08_01015 [Gammaproteobacteria bacterium]|nr:hypothetical protein [Gammaproteobacteria bacterium]MDA9117545.1 hypothetical protein [Gammaproteobacteria bacterium]
MIKFKAFVFITIFSFSSIATAGATECGSGECPVLERAKDVGDAAIKDLAPYIGFALIIGLAQSGGASSLDSAMFGLDKNNYDNGIQLLDPSSKYSIDVLSFSDHNSFDPLRKNNFSVNVFEIKYKFN